MAEVPKESRRRGRPRKFDGPCRRVTVTLPEEVIAALEGVNVDLSSAIVESVQVPAAPNGNAPAELITYGNQSVIVVPRTSRLTELAGVGLVPIADGRALISFDHQLSIPQLELQLVDGLRDDTLPAADRAIFESLVELLRSARRGDVMTLQQHSIIVVRHGAGPGVRQSVGLLATLAAWPLWELCAILG